jgi:hypothetical protein
LPSAALRDHALDTIIEVTGTWHHRLGEARNEIPKRPRTNITLLQHEPSTELDAIPSGLFGPVSLVEDPNP